MSSDPVADSLLWQNRLASMASVLTENQYARWRPRLPSSSASRTRSSRVFNERSRNGAVAARLDESPAGAGRRSAEILSSPVLKTSAGKLHHDDH